MYSKQMKKVRSSPQLFRLPTIQEPFKAASRSRAGCDAYQNMKQNQDVSIQSKFHGYYFFAVCDGHGVNGHLVSQYLKKHIPWKQSLSTDNLQNILESRLNSEGLNQGIIKSFIKTNKDLWTSEIDTSLSGSTLIGILIRDQEILCTNVGDSRAILCTRIQSWQAIQISLDHKPNNSKERARIINSDGRIHQSIVDGQYQGPDRVYLSYIDVPGLAMTRSFGDKIGAKAGVICDPDIIEFKRNKSHKFIILASDGVWDQLTNEEVMSNQQLRELLRKPSRDGNRTQWLGMIQLVLQYFSFDNQMKKSQKSELMTQASSTHTSESENKEVYKLFGRETALGKELFNLFNAHDKPKIDYPKPKQKTKEEKDQEKIKEKKSCPQKTVVEYPAPSQPTQTYHPIDFIQRRKPEAEIRKEIEAYYEGRKFYRPNIKGRDRKQLIEELQRIFKYKRGGLPKGAELPEVKYEVNEDDAKTSAIRKTHKKNLHFTGLKQDNQSDATTLQGDPIIELEILYTQIIKEIEERQEFLDEIQHLDEPKLKQKIKDEIIERVSELQKVQELRQKY